MLKKLKIFYLFIYFQKIYLLNLRNESGLSESIEEKWNVGEDSEVGFLAFINFMYDPCTTMTLSNAFIALDIAKTYQDVNFETCCKQVILKGMNKQNAILVWYVLQHDEDQFTELAEKKIKNIMKKHIPGHEGCTLDIVITFLQKLCWKDQFYGIKVIDILKDDFNEVLMLRSLLMACTNTRDVKFENYGLFGDECCGIVKDIIISGRVLDFKIAKNKTNDNYNFSISTNNYIPNGKKLEINTKVKIGKKVFNKVLEVKKSGEFSKIRYRLFSSSGWSARNQSYYQVYDAPYSSAQFISIYINLDNFLINFNYKLNCGN